MKKTVTKEELKREIEENVKNLYRRTIDEATEKQVFTAVAYTLKEYIIDDWIQTQKAYKKRDVKYVIYLSMEFLMGRALGNNLINLSARKEVREALEDLGFDLNAVEDQEPDYALGNGGLGRLAACFMDSLATLGYPAYGCGIRYRYGLFKQKIRDGYQEELPDDWLRDGNPFEIRRDEYAVEVRFGGSVRTDWDPAEQRNHFVQENYSAVRAVPYDLPVVGYHNGIVNTLRIWDAEPVDSFSLSSFDRGDYQKAVEQENLARNIVEVLYPNDNHYAGKELRLKQQYFFVSATLQRAVLMYKEQRGEDVHGLADMFVFQMNDTHPTLAIPELMRILMDEENFTWEEAWAVTSKCMAYTNHTIMSEALEKWPVDLFSRLLPRIYQIVQEIDRRFCDAIRARFPGDEGRLHRMRIIEDGRIRMAYMAIASGFSVNGVARLHTEILKNQELRDFYEMMPEKFNNKTNGITQRRFLLHGDPLLADWITEQIGDGWITDLPQLEKLAWCADDPKARKEFLEIKQRNKERLARYIWEHNGISVDTSSIFDVQIKRMHEYKRQLMNILHVMWLYEKVRQNPDLDMVPRTFIFGGKAAAGYEVAKLTIKLINSVADVINNDASIRGKIKVVFIEDYRVSNAEVLFAASEVSEQISTASKEASGTGNMKFMLNGAVTVGTMDGANVEIVEEVGRENAFIFGMSADEVIGHEQRGDYRPMEIFENDPEIRCVLMQLINGFYAPEDPERFRLIYRSLLEDTPGRRADTFFILKDLRSYAEAQQRVDEAYRDRDRWAKMAILNVAHAGKFSSDRTIEEYVRDIWHLKNVSL